MTLQQLKYAICIAETGTFGEAARQLYISQPSLSFAIKELEDELNITLFFRSNKGVLLTNVGREFIKKAKQIILQTKLLEEEFNSKPQKQCQLAVSTQHYTFASLALVDIVNSYADVNYELILHETKTMDVIADVKSLNSEIGIIYINKTNSPIINKMLSDYQLEFNELFTTYPYILVGKHNPLAEYTRVNIQDLAEFPCITFIQNNLEPNYFSEEVFGIVEQRKSIKISDRWALADLLVMTDAYVVSTGLYITVHDNEKKIVAVPLDTNDSDDKIKVGLIKHKSTILTEVANQFCNVIKKTIDDYSLENHIKRQY